MLLFACKFNRSEVANIACLHGVHREELEADEQPTSKMSSILVFPWFLYSITVAMSPNRKCSKLSHLPVFAPTAIDHSFMEQQFPFQVTPFYLTSLKYVEALIDTLTLKKRFALIAHTEIQQTQEL